MIAQGTDGLSCGAENEGALGGRNMMSYIPLHLSPFQRSPKLLEWTRSWLPEETIVLEPKDWYIGGHDIIGGDINEEGIWIPKIQKGTYIWDLPLAAAFAAIEELRKARIKQQDSLHIVLIPHLLTPMWQRQLFKASDLVLWIPPDLEC